MDRSLKNKYKTDSLYRFLLPEVFFRVFLRFYLILFYIPALRIYLVSPCQILDDRFIEHLGIYLCCLDRCMAQEFLDGGYRNALVNQESGTSVSAGMVGELLADMRHSSQFLQRSVGVGIAAYNAASCSRLSYFRIMPSAFPLNNRYSGILSFTPVLTLFNTNHSFPSIVIRFL